jgi:hypothetical protein
MNYNIIFYKTYQITEYSTQLLDNIKIPINYEISIFNSNAIIYEKENRKQIYVSGDSFIIPKQMTSLDFSQHYDLGNVKIFDCLYNIELGFDEIFEKGKSYRYYF